MSGKSHTSRRLATAAAAALASATAAVGVTAGFQSSNPKYGPPDPRALHYLNANPGALSAGFLTDMTDRARVARGHPTLVLVAARIPARTAAGALSACFLADTADSARVARTHRTLSRPYQ
jgi:hypothetical protein